jgi:ribosome maturation protein Sdo1
MAETRSIKADHTKLRRKALNQIKGEIAQIARGAMDQHQIRSTPRHRVMQALTINR